MEQLKEKKTDEILPKNEEILISKENLEYALTFTRKLFNGEMNLMNGILTPSLINSRMKDINQNPTSATATSLASALKDPKNSELQLQEFSQDFENQSQVYKKLLAYLGNILAFDLTYVSINAKKSDYKTKKYKDDLAIVADFLDRFDHKHEMSMVVQELLRNDAYFCCPRGINGNGKIVLQELPSSPIYTKIIGRWDYGFRFAFNMQWFLNPGVNIDMYPDFFKEAAKNLFGEDGKTKSYNPLSTISSSSSFAYWKNVDVDAGWCWKMNPSQALRFPYYTGLFLDLLQQPDMRALQKDVNMAAAAKMLIGEVPLLNKTTQSTQKDQFALSADNLGQFLSVVKQALGNEVKTAAVPLANIQGIDFTADSEIYATYLKTVISSAGVNANLIFSSDVRPNSVESQLSLNIDEAQMRFLYSPFDQFLEYHINKLTKNFKFRFQFEGTTFFNDRNNRFEKATSLAALGIVLPQKIAASIGMSPFDFQRQLEEAQGTEWVDSLTPIISSFQQSGDEAGAPEKSDEDLSDSGEETRSAGSNDDKIT